MTKTCLANAHKYSVSAMCCVLQLNRSTYYYEAKQKPDETQLTSEIKQVSRRRIGRIMKQEGLVSNYTTVLTIQKQFSDLRNVIRTV